MKTKHFFYALFLVVFLIVFNFDTQAQGRYYNNKYRYQKHHPQWRQRAPRPMVFAPVIIPMVPRPYYNHHRYHWKRYKRHPYTHTRPYCGDDIYQNYYR